MTGRNIERVKLLQARGIKSADEKSIHVSGNPFKLSNYREKNPGI
ncbi:hypothetical protein [Peribacillus frigoritolerans]|uniref:Uncharacterized protein n=1 Tax=Peribacillus castrilensis TaxID=2897690 RepID=A0AAW9N4N5_9BACI|nr:hypothetical protein [Peribacillus castrilensis]